MTLTKDDLQSLLQETENRLGKKIESLETRVDKRLMEQNIHLERRLRAETLKITGEFRQQARELKDSLVRVIKETFQLVYEDPPSTIMDPGNWTVKKAKIKSQKSDAKTIQCYL